MTPIKQARSRSAFSLTELTMVMIIIATLIAGVITANSMVSRARIASARSLTQTSPIASMTGVGFWFESSLATSIDPTQANDGSLVSFWNDNGPANNDAAQLNGANQPTYANTINRLHAVEFDGVNNFFNINGSFLNKSDYTIFVLEKRLSNKTANYFIGDGAITTANQTLTLGYDTDGSVIHSQGTGNSYTSGVSTYGNSTEVPRVFAFVSDSSGKKTYINGILAAQSSDNYPTIRN